MSILGGAAGAGGATYTSLTGTKSSMFFLTMSRILYSRDSPLDTSSVNISVNIARMSSWACSIISFSVLLDGFITLGFLNSAVMSISRLVSRSLSSGSDCSY